MLVKGDEPVREAAFAGASEPVPGHRGPSFGQDRVDADRSEGHPTAIDRKIDVHLGTSVPAPVEIEPGIDAGRMIAAIGRSESENAVGRSRRPILHAGFQAVLGSMPVSAWCQVERIKSDDQRGSPRTSADGLRIRERHVRATIDTVVVGLGASLARCRDGRVPQVNRYPSGCCARRVGRVPRSAAGLAVRAAQNLVASDGIPVALGRRAHLARHDVLDGLSSSWFA